jgi:hypothetical protein
MPIWLRKFTFKKIQEYFDKQNEEIEKQKQSMQNAQKIRNEVARPNIKSDYSFKAPKE